jgi:glycosyltransferase involved in cell wall biosynthesis
MSITGDKRARKKILFIHPALRSYRLKLFEKLNQDYDVKFVFLYRELEKFDETKIPVNWKYKNIFIHNNRNLLITSVNWIKLLLELLKSRDDLIFVSPAEAEHSFLSFFVSKLKNQKIILWGEGWYSNPKRFLRKIDSSLAILIMRNSDAVIGSGERSSGFYKYHLRTNNVFNAPNYVPTNKVKDIEDLKLKLIRMDKNILNKKVILYLSRILEGKGLDYLIRAFKLLENDMDNVFLLIGGDGPFANKCKDLAKQLEVKNILFVGYVPNQETSKYYVYCDVFVLPAIIYNNRPEPIGLVVPEAMSHGKPIIVTSAVGAAQYVQNNVNGFVVPEKNIKKLHESLLQILSDEDLSSKMGLNSRKLFEEKLGLEKQFLGFTSAIEYVLKKR